MNAVAPLLARGRKAKPEVSAVDAVMGKDWAIISPGRARKAREARLGLKIAHARDVARFGGGGGGLVPGGKPQAVVKMIRQGGASDLRGLRAQMDYLSRNRAEPLERSERYMGLEIDDEQTRAMERSWQMPRDGEGRADRTSHFIVSFPQDTDRDAAHRTGRDWTERMFGSGDFGGDSFDYYTAFHTDREHPHMHVVVYRRGLDHGAWLKVSQRSDLNYDRMREELVRVAARRSIELEASTRLSRGRHDRPVPDAEYRRAAKERRLPEAPAHTRETAIRAAAAMIHYARVFAADARKLEREAPEEAALLRKASDDIAQGRELAQAARRETSVRTESRVSKPELKPEARPVPSRVDAKRAEVMKNFAQLDSRVDEIEDRAVQMRFLRQVAAIKAQAVPDLRKPGELRAFAEPDESGRYRGLDASDLWHAAERAQAEERVREVAWRYGVDAGATVERHTGPAPSRGLARQFLAAEFEERQQSRAARKEARETPDEEQAAIARMHGEIGAVYRASRERADARRVRLDAACPASVAPATQPRDVEAEEDLPERVKARRARDTARMQRAEDIWQKRKDGHRQAMERDRTPERPPAKRDDRGRGEDDGPNDPPRRRRRRR